MTTRPIYIYLAAVCLFALYGIVGTIDAEDAMVAAAHKQETIAAAKRTAKLQKLESQAHTMLALDNLKGQK